MNPHIESTSADDSNQTADYMPNNPPSPPLSSNICCSNLFNKLSCADVMQYAEFDPKLALNEANSCEEDIATDPFHLPKLPVLNDSYIQLDNSRSLNFPDDLLGNNQEGCKGLSEERLDKGVEQCDHKARVEENTSMQLRIHCENLEKSQIREAKKKRKGPRTMKTSEEVESQRMIHIAVERNRRKQMNEHLRILRSLMPNSYIQRGDQASIVGGAIEFVTELEQILQHLESQKRRCVYGDCQKLIEDQSQAPSIFPTTPISNDQAKFMEYETGLLQEETAERKSCLADVEVKISGFDALINIFSRRLPGQLIKTIAALEDLQLHILHTNITTIEQTAVYSFNVKISVEARFTAEDIADAVQQILSFIHANSCLS